MANDQKPAEDASTLSSEGTPEQTAANAPTKHADSSTTEPSIAAKAPKDQSLNPNNQTETNNEETTRLQGERQAQLEQENKNTGKLPTLSVEADAKERKSVTDKLREVFLKLSGYKDKDVDGVEPRTRTLTTTNGGKYQLSARGAIRKLKGPDYPNWAPEE